MKKIIFLISVLFTSIGWSQVPQNDTCANAINLISSATCVTVDGTVDGATDDNLPQPSCDAYGGTYAGEGVWYKFTAQYPTNTIDVHPRGSSNIDAVLVIYSGDCNNLTEFDCKDDSGVGYSIINNSNFVVGETYYIRVYDYGSVPPTNGDFTICVQHFAGGGNVDLEYQDNITLDGISGNGTGDGDGFAEPGETISLAVNLKNNGTTTAHNVQATISTTDPDINITNATANYADIDAGTTGMSNDFEFSIAASAIEKDIIFSLNITSDEGTFTDSFLFHIYDANISIHQTDLLIRDGNGGGSGNSNGQVDAGESIQLEVKLHNAGTSVAHNVSSTISTQDPDISITNATVNLPDMPGGADEWAQSFNFDVSSACPDKDVVFTITTTSDEGSWIDQILIHVNASSTVNEISQNEVSIYPNPAHDFLHIKLNRSEIKEISIYNLSGQRILRTNSESVNIYQLKQGIYLLKIIDESGRVGNFKFIKR